MKGFSGNSLNRYKMPISRVKHIHALSFFQFLYIYFKQYEYKYKYEKLFIIIQTYKLYPRICPNRNNCIFQTPLSQCNAMETFCSFLVRTRHRPNCSNIENLQFVLVSLRTSCMFVLGRRMVAGGETGQLRWVADQISRDSTNIQTPLPIALTEGIN